MHGRGFSSATKEQLIGFFEHLESELDHSGFFNPPEKRPTLVLLDLNMPIMDGFQTLRLLRNNDAYKTIPVLVLTTSSQREDVSLAYSMGANSFIIKPHQYADLTRTVEQLQQFWLSTASISKATSRKRPMA